MSHQKPIPPSDDEAPDAWLKGALLHAPDAQVDAPAALTHNILRESRLALEGEAAVRRQPRSVQADATQSSHWLIAAWNRLTRPAVAAGFASVMVATLAGVLWWDKPLDEKGDPPMAARAPEVVAAAPAAPATAPMPAPMPAPAPAVSAAPAAVDAPRGATGVAQSTSSRRSAPEVMADKEALAGRAQSTAKRADEPLPRAKLAKPPQREEVAREADRDSAKAEVSIAAAPAPAAAGAAAPPAAPAAMPAPVAGMAAAASPPPETAALAQREGSAAFAKSAQDRSTSLQSASRAAPGPATAPANSAPITAFVAPLVASPLAPLLTALANAPEAWRWQADGGEPQAVTPALQSWLQRLDQSAGARWVTLGPSTRIDDAGGAAALELRVTSAGTSTRIVLARNTVTLQRSGAPPTTSSAVLTPVAADALRKAWADTLR